MPRGSLLVSLAAAVVVPAAAVAALAVPPAMVAASLVAAQPRHPIYLIYDGFVRNADGSLTLAYGYHNVNRVDVTVEGENNAFLTGAAHRGQPTVFLPGRRRFACVLVVPEAFDGRLQWQVRFAGHESVTTARVLDPLYALEEASAEQAVEGIELDGAPQGICLERDAMSERR